MCEKLMATRMRYLQTVVKSVRAEISTRELATNPFLRPSSPEIQTVLGMQGAELWEIFGETRRRKDRF